MRLRSFVAALVLGAALAACQLQPGGGDGSQSAPSQAQPSEAPASGTPYEAPGY